MAGFRKGQTGGEDPRDRNFDKAPGAAQATYEYSTQGKLHLLANGNSLSPWFETYDRKPATTVSLRLGGQGQEQYAKQQLVFFLLSNVRFRLAKCRKERCGTYFLLKHWNRPYTSGTLCDLCKRSRSEESAIRATADVRKWAKAQLHDLATKKFANQIRSNPDWHQQKELKDRIASFLEHQDCTLGWVARCLQNGPHREMGGSR